MHKHGAETILHGWQNYKQVIIIQKCFYYQGLPSRHDISKICVCDIWVVSTSLVDVPGGSELYYSTDGDSTDILSSCVCTTWITELFGSC